MDLYTSETGEHSQQNLFKRAFWNPSLPLQHRPTPLPYVLIQTSIFFLSPLSDKRLHFR